MIFDGINLKSFSFVFSEGCLKSEDKNLKALFLLLKKSTIGSSCQNKVKKNNKLS